MTTCKTNSRISHTSLLGATQIETVGFHLFLLGTPRDYQNLRACLPAMRWLPFITVSEQRKFSKAVTISTGPLLQLPSTTDSRLPTAEVAGSCPVPLPSSAFHASRNCRYGACARTSSFNQGPVTFLSIFVTRADH